MADEALLSVLEFLREHGALGEHSLLRAVAHAESFVGAVPLDCHELLDLGSGGGLPGLVIAARLPHVRVSLTDRREHRTDLLRQACAKLEFGARVTICTADVRDLAKNCEFRGSFDVVTARAFGGPLWTLECARPFLRQGGWAIVSEPPPFVERGKDDREGVALRWPAESLIRLDFAMDEEHLGVVRRFIRQ